MHRYVLHNNDLRRNDEACLLPGQVGFLNGWGVFSTLRVWNGSLFAFERHFARMRHDAALIGVPFNFSTAALHAALLRLIKANEASDAVLRVAVVRNKGGLFEANGLTREADLVAFTAERTQWPHGVHLMYVPNARFGRSVFSGAKLTSWAQNLAWYERAHDLGFDEAVLLNEQGEVSECTSANIFALQGDTVVTPPLSTSGCLPGVTRAILLEEIEVAGLNIFEEELTPSTLESSDGAFITSSTRDLLPILSIDRATLKQTPRKMDSLMRAFSVFRDSYFKGKQTAGSVLTYAKS